MLGADHVEAVAAVAQAQAGNCTCKSRRGRLEASAAAHLWPGGCGGFAGSCQAGGGLGKVKIQQHLGWLKEAIGWWAVQWSLAGGGGKAAAAARAVTPTHRTVPNTFGVVTHLSQVKHHCFWPCTDH